MRKINYFILLISLVFVGVIMSFIALIAFLIYKFPIISLSVILCGLLLYEVAVTYIFLRDRKRKANKRKNRIAES